MSPHKRDGSPNYQMQFTPDGYPDEIRRSTGVSNMREARAIEACLSALGRAGEHDLLDRVRDGVLSPKRLYGMREAGRLAELRREEADPRLEPVARAFCDAHPDDRLEYAIRRLLTVAPDDARVSWLADPENISELLAHYRDEGYAVRTEHREMSGIRQLVRERFGRERQREIFARVRLRPKPKDRVRYLERDEIEEVREASGDWWLIFGLYIATGMRRGELTSLLRRDIDLGTGQLTIERGKSKRARRTVPVGGEMLERLHQWDADRRLTSSEKLFPDVTYRKVGNIWNKVRRRAHVPDATIQGLRHTYGVHMARAGMPMIELKERMGHAKLETTMRYAEYAPRPVTEHYRRGLAGLGMARDSTERHTLRPTSANRELSEQSRKTGTGG